MATGKWQLATGESHGNDNGKSNDNGWGRGMCGSCRCFRRSPFASCQLPVAMPLSLLSPFASCQLPVATPLPLPPPLTRAVK
jgi:hypothetical protein